MYTEQENQEREIRKINLSLDYINDIIEITQNKELRSTLIESRRQLHLNLVLLHTVKAEG